MVSNPIVSDLVQFVDVGDGLFAGSIDVGTIDAGSDAGSINIVPVDQFLPFTHGELAATGTLVEEINPCLPGQAGDRLPAVTREGCAF